MVLLVGISGSLPVGAAVCTLKVKNKVEKSFNASDVMYSAYSNIFSKMLERKILLCGVLTVGLLCLLTCRNRFCRELYSLTFGLRREPDNVLKFKILEKAVERYEEFVSDVLDWVEFMVEESSGFVPGFSKWAERIEELDGWNDELSYETYYRRGTMLHFLKLDFLDIAFANQVENFGVIGDYHFLHHTMNFRGVALPQGLKKYNLGKDVFERFKNKANIDASDLNVVNSVIDELSERFVAVAEQITFNAVTRKKVEPLCKSIKTLLEGLPSDFMVKDVDSLKQRVVKSNRRLLAMHLKKLALVFALCNQLDNAVSDFEENYPDISVRAERSFTKFQLPIYPKYFPDYFQDHYFNNFKPFQ